MLSASHVLGHLERFKPPSKTHASGWPSGSTASSPSSSPNSSMHGETYFAVEHKTLLSPRMRTMMRGDSASSMHGGSDVAAAHVKSEAGLINGDFLLRASMTRSSLNRISSLPRIDEYASHAAELTALVQKHAANATAGTAPAALSREHILNLARALGSIPENMRANYFGVLLRHAPAGLVHEPIIARALMTVPVSQRNALFQQLRRMAPADQRSKDVGADGLSARWVAQADARLKSSHALLQAQQKTYEDLRSGFFPAFGMRHHEGPTVKAVIGEAPTLEHAPALEKQSFTALLHMLSALPADQREPAFRQLVVQAPPDGSAELARHLKFIPVRFTQNQHLAANPRLACRDEIIKHFSGRLGSALTTQRAGIAEHAKAEETLFHPYRLELQKHFRSTNDIAALVENHGGSAINMAKRVAEDDVQIAKAAQLHPDHVAEYCRLHLDDAELAREQPHMPSHAAIAEQTPVEPKPLTRQSMDIAALSSKKVTIKLRNVQSVSALLEHLAVKKNRDRSKS